MGTVVNIQTGGRSALSGLFRALLLLIVVLWAGGLTEHIPLAVLAGIALKVGFDIIDWSFLKRAHRVSLRASIIMYGVIGLTVFVDLITAVALGLFVANILTIERVERQLSKSVKAIGARADDSELAADEQTILEEAQGRILVFSLGGPLIFGLAKAISRQHAILPDHDVLVLDFSDVPMIGVSSSLALEKIVLESLENGRPVYIVGAQTEVRRRLEKLGFLERLPASNMTRSRKEALELADAWLDERAAGKNARAMQ
jgi:SulP family sulfate permease